MAALSSSAAADLDRLKLASHKGCRKMLSKIGENFPDLERVIMSIKLVKINKRGKEQMRVLLLTDKAIYNMRPKDYGKCKRRIGIEKVVSISLSAVSQEFAIHVPDEYDYRFKSEDRQAIVDAISDAFAAKAGGRELPVKATTESLDTVIVTKAASKQLSREDRLRRYHELLLSTQDCDEEKADARKARKCTSLLDPSKESVTPAHFEYLKVIGRGAFGKCMQVRMKETGKVYAMKILRKRDILAKRQAEHTATERRILQSLDHPFLMQLRFAFQTKAKLYLVLDYYRGGELFFHLKKKRRFTETQARFICAEVGLAIDHLHSLDVIYRDLKPENVLLDVSGHICLTDFGLSKDLTSATGAMESYTFCGTPEYLAPEIVSGSGHGKAVDWWALGVLLFELSVGVPPFYSQNVREMYKKIQSAPLVFPPWMSSNCQNLLKQLLIRAPASRLGSDGEFDSIFAEPFFSTLKKADLLAKKISPPYKPPRTDGILDTRLFDDAFTSEDPVDTYAPEPLLSAGTGAKFSGFTFMADDSGDLLS